MASRKSAKRRRATKRFLVFLLILLAMAMGVVFILYSCSPQEEREGGISDFLGLGSSTPKATGSPTPAPTPKPTPTPIPTPVPHESALPSGMGIEQEMNLNGEDIDSYTRPKSFEFGKPGTYTALEGITTFRSDHWRQNAAYGTADVQKKTLTAVWSIGTASLPKDYGSGSWTGSGWTGQPLIVKWPEATRSVMNLNDAKKDKDGLVEVIYATMDGNIYFLDLEDGKKTRSNIDVGLPFKGAGTIDPRGYPLLYLGAGDAVPAHHGRSAMKQEYFIYSLIDGERLYSFGKNSDPYAPRGWHAYDAAALIDAGTDTLLLPGENGIFYTLKLNSKFDAAAGTVSLNPGDMLKMRYTTARSREGTKNNTYWLGMETSPVMWHKWLYQADNNGTFMCIDTDTMEIIWTQDIWDDSNSTPVLEEENGKPVLYISTSLHWTKDKNNQGTIPVWKIDGLTGEILWQRDYECHTREGVSGGVEASGLLGQNDLSDLVFYAIARTPRSSNGKLVALNKKTGEEAWVYDMEQYPWSSPVAIYDKSGKGYVIICDTIGNMALLDGKTGTLLDQINLEGNIEASPAVYGDMIVVGTRTQKIWGIKIE